MSSSTPDPDATSQRSVCAKCGGALANVMGAQCPRCLMNLASSLGLVPDADTDPALLDAFQVRTFGDYELLEEIARGGMGVVYRARQISLGREVAIKMILAGELASKGSIEMFRREAHATANLHHPNIVPVYEIGEHQTQYYFTLRYVPGRKTIASWAEKRRTQFREIALATASAARAVAHAHAHGVLHRDLKPSNILWDDQAGPQVTDFGLARLMDQPSSTLTLSAKAIGSPSYMAPEQASGRVAEITTATDVYGIGAVLYELLSGRPPFSGPSLIETMRRAAEEEPEPLPQVPMDLRTICFKCLAKSPEHRYPSADALADDLERFARGEPVSAVPLSPIQTVWRWARRRPRIAALLALCIALLVAGMSGITWQWRKAEHARAEQAEALSRLRWQEIERWIEEGDSGRALAFLATLLRERPDHWQAAMYAMSIVEQNRFPLLASPDVQPPSKLVAPARIAPDGSWFATASEDGFVRCWDTASGREWLQIPHALPVTAIAVSAGPWKLAAATRDGAITVRAEISMASVPLTRGQPLPIHDLQFSADGSRLLVRCSERVEVWSAGAAEAPPAVIPLSVGIKGASISADGNRVLLWNAEHATVWDVASHKQLLDVSKRQEIRAAVLAAGGKRVACLDGKFHARIWDVDSGAALPEVESELPARHYLALNGDGTRLTFAGWGNDITVHDTASGVKISPVMRHNYHVDSLTPSPDGRRMLTFGWDEMLHVWDAETGRSLQAPVRMNVGRREVSISPSHDGRRVLIHATGKGAQPDSITIWESTARPTVKRHRVEGFRNFNSGAMSLDGALGWMGTDGYGPTRVHVYEIATGKVLLDAPTVGEVYDTLFSTDRTRCYVLTIAGTVHGFSLKNGQPLWAPNRQTGGIIPAALSPDGARIVAGHTDGHIRIYDTVAGKVVHEMSGLGELRTLRFAPDGSGRFISGGVAGVLHLWNVNTGEKLQTFPGHSGTVLATAWSRDSSTLASASGDNTVRLWNVITGQPVAPALPHLAVPTHLEFSPVGSRLATCSRDGTVRLWDSRTGQPASPPLRQGLACTTVRFTTDGAVFFVHDHDGFRFWDAGTALPVTRHYAEPVAGGFAFDSEASHSFMTPDGSGVFLSYARNDGVFHHVPQPRGPVPDWFPDFLEMLAQMRLDDSGAMRLIPHVQAAEFLKRIQASSAQEEFGAWALKTLGNPKG